MKLTSILPIVGLCLQFTLASGQSSRFSYGIQLQPRISDLIYSYPPSPNHEKTVRESTIWRFSPGIAPWAQFRLNDRVAFRAGLGYELSGYRLKEYVLRTFTPQNPEPVRLGTAKATMHYHDLNFSLLVRVKPFKKAQRFYLNGGFSQLVNIGRYKTIVINYDTGERYKGTEPLVSDDPSVVSNPDLTPVNVRADIGFGFELMAGKKVRWYAEPMFGYTILPVSTYSGSESRQYVTGVNIGLGW